MKFSWKAARGAAALSILFLVVYGACNRLTALRPDVGSFYFGWERRIPFIPAMIVPYMSIDLFFVAAPFLASTDRERRLFSRRIIAAILIAGACFLIHPLKFAFERPHTDGPLGVLFDTFRKMDLPYNQFPSLHIALRTILAHLYARHTRGVLRALSAIWFSLIGFSTIFTYQHHVIDVVGGFALAAACFYFVRDEPLRQSVMPNYRVGAYYFAGAALFSLLAVVLRPYGLVLVWPATSFALYGAGCIWLGPGIFRKEGGRLPRSTWVMLWPVLLGQRVSLVYYARQCRAYDALTDRLWIGRRLSGAEASEARAAGVRAVVDLTGEFSETHPFREADYKQVPVMDLTAPTATQIDEAVAFIRAQAEQGVVYLHCKIGYSRTAAIAGAFLLATGRAKTVEEAVAAMRAVRPSMVIRPEAIRALHEYAARSTGA